MKDFTKQIARDFDLCEIKRVLNCKTNKIFPLIFLNGEAVGVAESDLKVIKTDFNFSEKENKLPFVFLPLTFDLCSRETDEYLPDKKFAFEYINRLKVISYLPEEILSKVEDKRLLSLGYAAPEVAKAVNGYVDGKIEAAQAIEDKTEKYSIEVCSELSIQKQFKKDKLFYRSIVDFFANSTISNLYDDKENTYIELDGCTTIALQKCTTIEEEVNPINTNVRSFELHKSKKGYELHFLLIKLESNLEENYYYATYEFTDMKLVA